jgi:hypothetical protein
VPCEGFYSGHIRDKRLLSVAKAQTEFLNGFFLGSLGQLAVMKICRIGNLVSSGLHFYHLSFFFFNLRICRKARTTSSHRAETEGTHKGFACDYPELAGTRSFNKRHPYRSCTAVCKWLLDPCLCYDQAFYFLSVEAGTWMFQVSMTNKAEISQAYLDTFVADSICIELCEGNL